MPNTSVNYLDIQNIYYAIYVFIKNFGTPEGGFFDQWFVIYLKLGLFTLTMIFSALIVLVTMRIIKMKREELKIFLESMKPSEEPGMKMNGKWVKIMEMIETENSSEWTHAIIEADKLLDQMLIDIGYKGESLGDRLMSVEKGDMLSLNEAWEAHKTRNRIAHETNFLLSKGEALKVVRMYEKVFREYHYI